MPVYADITKPPAPLPQPKPQSVGEGITLLPPLSRLGHGPGLVILTEDSEKHLQIVEGVPSALIKWAEEGYTVVEIQSKALNKGAKEAVDVALKALRSCDKLEPKDSKIGVVGKSSPSWTYMVCRTDLNNNSIRPRTMESDGRNTHWFTKCGRRRGI